MEDLTHLSARQRRIRRGTWTPRPKLDRTERRTYIYYCIDAEGVVLYVGRSSRPLRRLRDHHSSGAEWAPRVVQFEGHGPYAWDEAVRRERQEIRRLRPRYNIEGLDLAGMTVEPSLR